MGTFRQGLFAVLFSAIGLMLASAALAQTQQQINWCNGNDGATADLQISGCTAIIQFGKLNPLIALNNRGNAFENKGQYDRAIQDFDQAIRLNPQYADAYNNRGLVYKNIGQIDRAIQDYDQAIRLNPRLSQAFNNRGNAFNNKGQYDRAIADYRTAYRINPKDDAAYNILRSAVRAKEMIDPAMADIPHLAAGFAEWCTKNGLEADGVYDFGEGRDGTIDKSNCADAIRNIILSASIFVKSSPGCKKLIDEEQNKTNLAFIDWVRRHPEHGNRKLTCAVLYWGLDTYKCPASKNKTFIEWCGKN